jgi:hypothetical protein
LGLEIEYFNLGRNLIKNETRYQSGLQNIVGMTEHFSNLFLDDLAPIHAYVVQFGKAGFLP